MVFRHEPFRHEQGELVCTFPIPSMPIYFWDDADGQKYHDAYFDVFPGAWRHGDYIEIHSDTGGVTFYGRSDSILKPSGVRIGTSEIYAQVQKVDEVQDSLAVGQQYEDDERVILFVQMKEGEVLTADVAKRIRAELRLNASPRHVPKLIMETKDIPKTLNGKIVEGAVTNILHRRKVTNRDALQNPEILDFFESLLPLLEASEAETMASELVF
jgi:acetoacetyl-CoA synthetase